MEYIEREAAKQKLAPAINDPEAIDFWEWQCSEIDGIPAADIRPVVRAHWYWDKDGMDWGIGSWRCSACHNRPETWWQGDRSNPRNKSGHYFCPTAGLT